MSKIAEIAQAVESGKLITVETLVKAALDEGIDARTILAEGMLGAMDKVGDRFQKGEIFVPEMFIAARAMKAGLDILQPLLADKGGAGRGTCIIGTVHGDLHDIGKNLVALMIESAGFEVIDLGVDVLVDTFIKAIKETAGVKLVALSCLLTTTMPAMLETAAAIKAEGMPEVKLIVGGAPITPAFAEEVGADGYAPDAGSAGQLAKRMVS